MKGNKVLFAPVSEMLHNLNAAEADNSYYQKVDYYLRPDFEGQVRKIIFSEEYSKLLGSIRSFLSITYNINE